MGGPGLEINVDQWTGLGSAK